MFGPTNVKPLETFSDSFNNPFKCLPIRHLLFGLYLNIISGPTFIYAPKSWLCFSYLEESFVSVEHLKTEMNISAQYVYVTTRTGCLLSGGLVDVYCSVVWNWYVQMWANFRGLWEHNS